MFNYFNKNIPLDNIIDLIEENINPKIIFCNYDVLINENNNLHECTSMFKHNLKKFLTYDNTLEFIIFNNKKTPKNMEDGFLLNDILEPIYNQNIFNINFFKENKKYIDKINNIIYINNHINQNDFLYTLCIDDFYTKPYSEPLDIYLIFSSVLDVLDFILRFKVSPNLHIILYNTTFKILNKYEKQIFEFINNILELK